MIESVFPVVWSSELNPQTPWIEINTSASKMLVVAGHKLSAVWLQDNFDCLELTKKKESGKLRPYMRCKICQECEAVARKYSNGSLPLIAGIRVDSQQKLQRVVDHLDGKSHDEAVKAKVQHELWNARS